MEIQPILGVAAAVTATAAYIPYIRSILKGKTKPNRASWWIWAVLGVIISASYWSVGARNSFWVTLPIGIVTTALLSLRYGIGGWTPFDRACLAGAGAGLAMWLLSGSPALALYICIFTDAVGYLPTLRKVYLDPGSEDKLTWCLFFAAGVLSLLSIDKWSAEIAIYPVYACISLPIVIALLFRKPRKS